MDDLIRLGVSVFLIWFGYSLVKTGVTAIRKRDKGVGPLDPRMGVFTGAIGIIAGLVILLKFVLLPMLTE